MYSESNGEVTLKMPHEDYEIVLMALGAYTALTWKKDGGDRMLKLLNRLNQGNHNYVPYKMSE